MKVFITGATGLIGPRLIRALRNRGDEVAIVSRRENAWERVGQDVSVVVGDPTVPGEWQDAAASCDAIINLAGAGVFDKRWSTAYKTALEDSRLKSTAHCVAALSRAPKRADGSGKVLVNGSAIGFYGPHGDEIVTEETPSGTDFMARLCVKWEAEARKAEDHGVRVSMVRTGIVLDKRGGALKQLLLPFQMGAGGPVGSGRQYMSWIHYADIVGVFMLALDRSEARGPINGTAPEPVTNKEFGKALGAALGRPAFMPTPGFALRLALGEVAEILTEGARVVPAKAEALGYRFQYPTIAQAFKAILNSQSAAA